MTTETLIQQEDREVAADFGRENGWPTLLRLHTREGKHDDLPLVQLVAGIRQSAYAAGIEDAAKVAEAEEELEGEPPRELAWCENELRAAVRVTKRNIVAAIRNLGDHL